MKGDLDGDCLVSVGGCGGFAGESWRVERVLLEVIDGEWFLNAHGGV